MTSQRKEHLEQKKWKTRCALWKTNLRKEMKQLVGGEGRLYLWRSLVLLRLSPRTGTYPLCLISSLYQTGHCQVAQTKMLICLKTVSVCWGIFFSRALHNTVRYLIYHFSFPFPPKIVLSVVGPTSGFTLPLGNSVAAATEALFPECHNFVCVPSRHVAVL